MGARVIHQPVEHGRVLLEQGVGGVKLLDFARGHGEHLVREDDGVQAMGDGDGGAPLEHTANGLLNELVCLQVHGGGGLVQHQHTGLLQHTAGHADQLLLAEGEIGAALSHSRVQAAGHVSHRLLHVHHLQAVPQLLVGGVVEGVKVAAHSPLEHDRLLGDDGQTGTHLVQGQCTNVDPVDDDAAIGKLKHAEERHEQRCLARAGATHDADLSLVLDVEGHVLQG
mmetsp:Transcript_11550/g.20526  ORF Transcript_11550/g.20526 Transcript_11550/m.20526 type:complete len:225 (+) Transcript_11550:877-1551(+)